MRLFDRFYYGALKHGTTPGLIQEIEITIPESEVDDLMKQGIRVYREDGIWGNILRWIRS